MTHCFCGSSSGTRFLTLFPCPSVSPSHRRKSYRNFSSMSVSHRLQLFTHCSSEGPFARGQSFRNRLLQCGVTGPARKTAPVWGLLSIGLQVPARTLLLHGLHTGPLLGIPLLQPGLLQGLQVHLCTPMPSNGCRGTAASAQFAPWAAEESQIQSLEQHLLLLL